MFKHSGHKRAGASGEGQGDDLGTTPSRGKGLPGRRRRQEGPGLCGEEPRRCGDGGEEVEDERRRKRTLGVTERGAEEEYHQRGKHQKENLMRKEQTERRRRKERERGTVKSVQM